MNDLSNFQVFVAHSFWVIGRDVSRTFVEVLYGDAILVRRFWYINMAAGNQQKHLEFTVSIKALSYPSRTSTRAHKRIF